MTKNYYVYIMASSTGTLYVGVTNDLERRVVEHKEKLVEGFSKKYNTNKLVYFEHDFYIGAAIIREKQIKGWRRSKKIDLIKIGNPGWKDLSLEWGDAGYNAILSGT